MVNTAKKQAALITDEIFMLMWFTIQ